MSCGKKRVLVAAGGTGGHFYPGLVLAQELKARGWEPLFLVRREDAALTILEREGLPSLEVDLSGLPRAFSPRLLSFAWKLGGALRLVYRAMRDFGPRAVIGMGGYLTFPAVLAAARRGIPRAVHESNSVLGLANRASLIFGARLFWGLPPTPGQPRGILVGTPVRPALRVDRDRADARRELGLPPDGPCALVFGGSQGAHGVNREAPPALCQAARRAAGRLGVLHLAGSSDEFAVRAAYAGAPVTAVVLPYLERMELAYAAADLAVCRAGASTLAELCARRLPAVLVPFPHAAHNHQELNARIFERAGACAVLLERELPSRLGATLADLLFSQDDRRARMAAAYASLGLPPAGAAAARLADAVESLTS